MKRNRIIMQTLLFSGSLADFETKGLEFETPWKFRQEGHQELKVLRCSSKSLVRKQVCGGRHTLNKRD